MPDTKLAPPSTEAGKMLPPTLRHWMGTLMGKSFSTCVFMNEGHSATLVGANAYTKGNDIHFAPSHVSAVHRRG